MASSIEVDLANKYQQKTDKQHILDNPDTYIGSVENVDTDMWIMNETNEQIIEKNIRYIPGLFKLVKGVRDIERSMSYEPGPRILFKNELISI